MYRSVGAAARPGLGSAVSQRAPPAGIRATRSNASWVGEVAVVAAAASVLGWFGGGRSGELGLLRHVAPARSCRRVSEGEPSARHRAERNSPCRRKDRADRPNGTISRRAEWTKMRYYIGAYVPAKSRLRIDPIRAAGPP